MLCIVPEMLGVQMSSLWGYMYTSTSSMDSGDLFVPAVKIVHLEFLHKYSRFYTSVKLCVTLWNPLEHTLEKSGVF